MHCDVASPANFTTIKGEVRAIMALTQVCRCFRDWVTTRSRASLLIRPFVMLARKGTTWAKIPRNCKIPLTCFDIHVNGDICTFRNAPMKGLHVIIQGWHMIRHRELRFRNEPCLVVAFRRRSHIEAPGLMISTITHKGVHHSLILDTETATHTCCITSDGGFITAKVPPNTASTNKSCLYAYTPDGTRSIIPVLGVMVRAYFLLVSWLHLADVFLGRVY